MSRCETLRLHASISGNYHLFFMAIHTERAIVYSEMGNMKKALWESDLTLAHGILAEPK